MSGYFAKRLGVKKLRNKNKSGFTLIELLVVIAIIGLLASVVLLALNSARSKSRDAKRLADVRQIASAMELFFNDNASYPTNTYAVATYNKLDIGPTSGGAAGSTVGTGSKLVPNYIGLIPSAPLPNDPPCGATGQGSNEYDYAGENSVLSSSAYTLTFCLGAATGGYVAGPHTLTPAGIQ